MVETERKHVEKLNVTLEQKVKGDFTYWKKWVWDKDEPLVMVLANYPVTRPLMGDNLTSILIRNAIVDRGTFGGVVIANLFNAQVKWPGNKRLEAASASDGVEELVTVTKGVDKVIIATGTLTTKYEVAMVRLADYIDQCAAMKQKDKLFWLLSDGGKKVHPLALRDAPWEFGPVKTLDQSKSKRGKVIDEPKLKIVKDNADQLKETDDE
ncbi:DUF1643 domain-containing protein [Lactiplantibacillus plantarum]|uniref:DUF1643 domain-containing protein n=1 Tax=Lactiplantibacillus plantarum TaxID=1590 RepID=UPI0010768017|nr:DUF1643 domain-containing protein [Lactiplantibacillus plantarum]TFZ24323.1 DUF1643 domain-containing protein [Lactiplantibacillus plantarum]